MTEIELQAELNDLRMSKGAQPLFDAVKRHIAENVDPITEEFFRLGEKKFHPKGVTYGPFAPNEAGERYASREQTLRDFAQIRELGANTLRVYHVPPHWFLDLAHEHGLKVLVDIPWRKDRCFLDSPALCAEARTAVREAVALCARHPAVFAFSLVNEIPSDIVRWSGAVRVAEFIEELVNEALAASTYNDHIMPYGPTKFEKGQNTGAQPANTQILKSNVEVIYPQEFASAKAVFPIP